jgi:hypothetical protein
VLCASTLVMMAASWPLWLDSGDFPRVPFLAGLGEGPAWVTAVLFAGAVSGLVVGMVAPVGRFRVATERRGWLALGIPREAGRIFFDGRGGVSLAVVMILLLVLKDQGRFQPWVYQFLVVGLAVATLPDRRALRMARLYAVGLYAYSGLSKLDASFVAELGPVFLDAGLGLVGQSSAGLAPRLRTLAILAMPAAEVAVAGALAFGSTRGVGLVGAVGLHAALIAILGPWSLGQSPNVLIWNGALLVEAILLFGGSSETDDTPAGRPGWVAMGVVVASLVLPLGERFGLCDAWPAHALYASHAERSQITIHEDDLERVPEPIRRHFAPAGAGLYHGLDLTGWSREVRGVPPYPSHRYAIGVAEWLDKRVQPRQPIRLTLWERAPVLTSERLRRELVGVEAIPSEGARHALNCRPAVDR